MKNKKVLSLLLAGVMITAIPFNVFADEPEEVKADKTAVVETVEKEDEAKVETTESETLEISEEKVSEELKAPAPTDPVVQEFKVKFDSDGGSAVAEQSVKEGEMAKEPPAPTKDGFDFVEWQKDGVKFEFTTPITAEITLKAVWKSKTPTPATEKFTVKFNSDGGSLVAEQTIEKGKMAKEPPAPTKDGYNFLGWYDGSDKFDFKSTPIIADKNLIA
ncbi:MAG: InlB B-repeat-containing protein, partial [Peptoniphilus grossensis]